MLNNLKRLIMKAVKLNEGFDLVCVWPATLVDKEQISEFEDWFKNEFGIECQYLEEVKTFPDRDEDGNIVEDTGGRNDVFFAIKNEDVPKFAIKRLGYGIRWAEDAVPQDENIYPEYVKEYLK